LLGQQAKDMCGAGTVAFFSDFAVRCVNKICERSAVCEQHLLKLITMCLWKWMSQKKLFKILG